MFTRDDEKKLRFLDVKLWDWPVLVMFIGITTTPIVGIPFAGVPWFHGAIALVVYSPIAFLGIRMIYRMSKSNGKDLDWDRLPEVLPRMVRAKVFTREQAIRIYDCFSYQATLLERAWDLRVFAPLPPKRYLWFLEE